MRRIATCSLGVILVLFVNSIFAAPELVGELGEIERIGIVGNQTFDSKQLRAVLGFNLDVLLAGHPDAPLENLLRSLERKLVDGYRNSGFADALVTANFNEQRGTVVVEINEGSRSVCGGIEIVGARTLSVERLKNLLMARWIDPKDEKAAATPAVPGAPKQPSKSKDPVWQKGKPASFAVGHWREQTEPIRRAFDSLGYFDPTFTTTVRAESDRTATLVVEIRDEGPRAVLGEIEVTGVQKNSVEDVVKYLDLQIGMPLDSEVKARIEQKLWDAARFLKHDIEILTPPLGNGPSNLRITLVEYADAPPLSEKLSPEEQAMVRFAHWLNALSTSDDDLDLEITSPLSSDEGIEKKLADGTFVGLVIHLRAIMSHREQSCLVNLRLVELPERVWFDVWIQLNPQLMVIDSPRHRLRFEAYDIQQQVHATMTWRGQPPDAAGRMTRFEYGIGVNSSETSNDPTSIPFVYQVKAAPVAALREVHRDSEGFRLKDGLLSMESDKTSWAVEAKSGRLIEFQMERGPYDKLRAVCRAGLYREALAEHKQRTAGAQTIRAGDAPISSILSFVAQCLPDFQSDTDTQPQRKLAALGQRLLKRGAFRAFDDVLLDLHRTPEDEFTIPPDADPKRATTQVKWIAWILPVSRAIVPNPSWTWTISREFVFASSRRSPHTVRAIDGLYNSPETGPVAHLTSSYVLGMLDPRMKIAFARRGLEKMLREDFQHDYEPFLHDTSPIGKLLLATAATLQEIDDDEIESLVEQMSLSDADRSSLAHALRMFPANRAIRPSDALRAAFDEAWEPLIKPRIQSLLEQRAK